MEKNVKKALSNFVGEPEENTNKNVVLNEREGLIERVDRVFVTRNGKQLLREHY